MGMEPSPGDRTRRRPVPEHWNPSIQGEVAADHVLDDFRSDAAEAPT
jgi:hypothetical protein